jgi:hypothetical protein
MILIAFVLMAATIHAKTKLNWQTGRLIDTKWEVTAQARTRMVSQKATVTREPLITSGKGRSNSQIQNQNPKTIFVKVPQYVPEKGVFLYTIESDAMTYIMASKNRLNVSLNTSIQYAFDENNAYILQDNKKRAKIELIQKISK